MKEYRRYLIGVLLLVVAITLIVFGFIFIRNLFRGDSKVQEIGAPKVNLLEVANNDKPVSYTVHGNIVGEESYRSIRITVNSTSRKVEVLKGYEEEVLKSQETENTQLAYQAFISAINGAGFSNSIGPRGRGEEAQSCPLGQRYNYEVAAGTADAFRTWSASCSGKLGTFKGNNSLVQTLFQRQIPNYTQYVSDVKLTP